MTHKHAAYLLVVKTNQPALQQQLKTLPWRNIRVADTTHHRGHGRAETRCLQGTTVAGLDFPHATQALGITRRVRSLGSRRWRTVTVNAVTSLTAAQAHPARLADWIRGHWGTEALHHIRDVTVAEHAVWTRVTHGEHFFAPLVLEEQHRSGRRQLASLASRVARGSRVGRPEYHSARLMTALDAYADQLAAHIDAGKSAALAGIGQLASVFLAS